MDALWLALSTLLLSIPVMMALWHQGAVGRLLALHQFRPGLTLYRWGSRRSFSILWRALLAIGLTAAVLLQSVFFEPLEWLLLGVSPLLYLVMRALIEVNAAQQFSEQVYAQRWSIWASQWTVTLVLTLVWVAARLALADAPPKPYADLIYAMQSGWTLAPSGIVKWALDAGAWGQATVNALGQLPEDATWRLLLALVIAPAAVFGHLALTFSGLSLPIAELRRTMGERLTASDHPPPVGPARAAVWSAIATVGTMLLFYLVGITDSSLKNLSSPFAVKPLPDCERIGGTVYQVNTIELLKSHMDEATGRMGAYQGAACGKLTDVERLAGQGVDNYLDWYFSLGAEWSRLAAMLAGDIDVLLQDKFSQLVLSTPAVGGLLTDVQADYARQWKVVVEGQSRALELLAQNRLVLSDKQCRVKKELAVDPSTAQFDAYKARLATGSGTALIAGAFAAKVAAKAMSKVSMKSAAKVLMKAAAKKGIGKLGAAAAGAAMGTMVAPGLGTAVGAVIGAGVGLVIGIGVDITMLAAEEKLTRADMRQDLLGALTESLQTYRDTFECR